MLKVTAIQLSSCCCEQQLIGYGQRRVDGMSCKLSCKLRPQGLHAHCPDIVTLDLRKIAGKGITMGSDFRVPALKDADRCFGPASLVRPTQQRRVEIQNSCSDCCSSGADAWMLRHVCQWPCMLHAVLIPG